MWVVNMDLLLVHQTIITPISQLNPVGERLVECDELEFIEQQLMKVGSLSHSAVEWDKVESTVLKLLQHKSKDIRLLVYLLQCLHHQISPARFIASMHVMTGFIETYWETSFPLQGDRGSKSRRKYFGLMLQRISLVIEKMDFSTFDREQQNSVLIVIEQWVKAIEEKQLANTLVNTIADSISNGIKRAQQSLDQNQSTRPDQNDLSSDKHTTFDLSDEKSAKQTYLKLADSLKDQGLGAELAIRLRRYAIWGSIYSLPEHRPDGETLLRGMTSERIKEYQDELSHPSTALWYKVEHSLTLSPFWFSGQLMSSFIAQKIGHPSWAKVIADETLKFLQRMPSLNELKFKGGEPFVSDEVKEWLDTYASSNTLKSQGEWPDRRKEAFLLAKESGIASALDMVNVGINAARDVKDQFHWRLLAADLLKDNNLGGIAVSQYQTLYQQLKNTDISNWETGLLEKLRKHSTSE